MPSKTPSFFSIATFTKSWWVIGFFLLCAICYERGLKGRDETYIKLKDQLILLQKEKEKALALQEDLRQQINSQSDSAFIELTLMKGLGLSPENQQKVYFEKTDHKINKDNKWQHDRMGEDQAG